jgi:hypothetical protein
VLADIVTPVSSVTISTCSMNKSTSWT